MLCSLYRLRFITKSSSVDLFVEVKKSGSVLRQKVRTKGQEIMKELTEESEYNDILKTAGNRLLVLQFGASWCGPCRMMAPYLNKLEAEYEGSVVFAKVDVDELSDLAEEEGIECMPTFILYKDNSKAPHRPEINYHWTLTSAEDYKRASELHTKVTVMPGANKEKLKQLIDEHK